MIRRRRPILRTAVVGGAAYAAGSHSAQKSAEQAQQEAQQNAQIADLQQQQQAAAQPPAPPPPTYQQPAPPPPQAAAPAPPAGAMTADKIEQLKQLGALRDAKVLTDAEFEAEKKKILG
ncbi:MAG TPA: SHOCT domain-containing protein [Ktedonobacteraceae bacterium]|nr:SHOCT domain-containing protein [Ktedonobacteraceae bacterium]